MWFVKFPTQGLYIYIYIEGNYETFLWIFQQHIIPNNTKLHSKGWYLGQISEGKVNNFYNDEDKKTWKENKGLNINSASGDGLSRKEPQTEH